MHVITGLGTGGAEMMLCKVLQEIRNDVVCKVVSLMDRGAQARRIENLGIPVVSIGMRRGSLPGMAQLIRIVGIARKFSPTHVQGWMYHGNLTASMVSALIRPRPVLLWNVRQTLYSLERESRLTGYLIRLGALLSSSPRVIVYNSRVSAEQHERIGYLPSGRLVIPNGFDLDRFRPAPERRAVLRRELGIGPDRTVIGHIARFHPMKGHLVMLEAAARIVQRIASACFVFAGLGMDSANADLRAAIDRLGLGNRVVLLGERNDIELLLTAIDIAVLPSLWGDAFPNVVGEAMATGVPCVVSDIGDAGVLVGSCGRVVPPGDVAALADAVCGLVEAGPDNIAELARASRRRIADNYSLASIGAAYRRLYFGST